jgi:hypothetical protein
VPTQPYKLNGVRIPSVTTITGRFKESGGLLYWANQQGLEGKTLNEAREEVTTPGTIAHAWVEDFAHKRPLRRFEVSLEILRQADNAYSAFTEWFSMHQIVLRHVEVSLVSEKHRYGGTSDAIGTNHRDELILLDWKNAAAVYPDNLYQLAGYKIAWEENYPDHPIVGGVHLCRFAKEGGDFSHHYFPSLKEEEQTFLLMRALYDRVKLTEKRVR